MAQKDNKFAATAKQLAYIALFSATLTGGKMALAPFPNVEIVTILILVYASTFGVGYVLPATMIFCAVESMLFGFGSWVISYFLYWNALGVVAAVLLRKQKMWQALVLAFAATAFFGVLTSAVDVVLISFSRKTAGDFFKYFASAYVLGIWFCVFHVASAVVSVLVLYKPLCLILNKIKLKTLGED